MSTRLRNAIAACSAPAGHEHCAACGEALYRLQRAAGAGDQSAATDCRVLLDRHAASAIVSGRKATAE